MFKANVLGRLGRDSRVLTSSSGVQFLAFTIAVNTKNQNGDVTYWIDIRSFNKQHIKLASYLTKGKIVMCGGDFNTGTMLDKTNNLRVTHSMLADYITFVNLGNGSKQNSDASAASEPVVEKGSDDKVVYNNDNTPSNEDEIVMNIPVKVSSEELVSVPVGVASDSDDSDDLPF